MSKFGIDGDPVSLATSERIIGGRTVSLTTLRRAAGGSDAALVSWLLVHGGWSAAEIELYGADSSGKGPLHFAAWRGTIEAVEVLLDFGLDANRISTGMHNYGKTPVFYALTRCRDDVALLLLARGAIAHIVNNKGQSVVSLAASHCAPATTATVAAAEAREAELGAAWVNYRASHSDGLWCVAAWPFCFGEC
jgi:hypothetical protein